MYNKKCLICGSQNIKADRSLGGRMVCSNCGSLKIKENKINNYFFNIRKDFKSAIIFIFIILIIILLII